MKYLKHILTVALTVLLMAPTFSQDRRTLETKVADILAQFPAQNNEHTDRLVSEIAQLGPDGIARFCNLIVTPGTGDDTQARYALNSLAQFAGAPGQENIRGMVENALLTALAKASDKEVKAFFIGRLAYCGQSATISALETYLNSPDLFSPAVATLTTIGSEEAAQAIFRNLPKQPVAAQIEFIKDLGVLKYRPAEPYLISLASTAEPATLKQVYAALGQLGEKASEPVFRAAVQKAGYAPDATNTMVSYLDYLKNLADNGERSLSNSLCNDILKKCTHPAQLQFRSSALAIIRANQGTEAMPVLLKEFKNPDKTYRNAVLQVAGNGLTTDEVNQWIGLLKKTSPEIQGELLAFLANRPEEAVLEKAILPSLSSPDLSVRQEAIAALVMNQKAKSVPVLLEQLKKTQSDEELAALEKALLTACSTKECDILAGQINEQPNSGKVVILHVLAARRATRHYKLAKQLIASTDPNVSQANFSALKSLAEPEDIESLIALLKKTDRPDETEAVRQAIIALYTNDNAPSPTIILNEITSGDQKEKLIPVLPFLNDKSALKSVVSILKTGQPGEKESAFRALTNWTSVDALPALFDVFTNQAQPAFRKDALASYLKLALNNQNPDDQKLLWLEKIMPQCTSTEEQNRVIDAAGSVKTFLSLVFVAPYLDQDALSGTAAMAAMKIALPSPGEKNGLTGQIVRQTLEKVKAKITGPDSQYFKIDIQEYLDKMPDEPGYVPIFNGKDLSGWQGLVKNPIERAKMSPKELAKEQEKANLKMLENWSVKDGCIVFNGNGDNLCTRKNYKDFDMLVDWRISKEGDSGIYLRGSPQVQIWDTSRVDVGAQVGSGGLYNNQKNPSKPLVLADNAIGDWNTFRIRMVDQRVTVYLNGVLVVDNVIMENYWDRNIPIFSEGPIELQAHGTDLAFRNIYVREINPDNAALSDAEKAEGFVSLFNGRDLDNWIGNKTDYVVENGVLAIHPKEGSHGNLYTAKEYSNFIFRFEFLLTPGANNGLGIHAPLEGDAAYVGKELQILDNTAPIYADLQPYQYHGSVYGIIPAKREFLKPVGEWNYEEVIVKGDDIKITLNGEVIVNGNVKEATKNGTPDHKDHPGLERHTGHIGFLGHGSELKFRNIRIKELD
jgi:HEAT repeat protein